MKQVKLFIILLITSLFIGCSDDFLDRESKEFYEQETYYNSELAADKAVIACYDPLKGLGLFGLTLVGAGYAFEKDIYAENGTAYSPLNEYIFRTTNGDVELIYHALCEGVNSCNVALEKIPAIEMADDKKALLLAQARFMRAIYYFYQTALFNTPPLIDKVLTKTEFNKQVNASKLKFKSAIVNDMLISASILPPFWSDDQVGRATKGAAHAMLGKIYLYNEQWDSAKYYLNLVVSSGLYGLMIPKSNDSANYIAAYLCNFSSMDITVGGNIYRSENNEESIFEIQNNEDYVWNDFLPGYGHNGSMLNQYFGPNGYTNVGVLPSFGDRFEKNINGMKFEPRYYACIWTQGDTVVTTCGSDFGFTKHGLPPADILYNGVGGFTYSLKKYYYPVQCGLAVGGKKPDPNNYRLIRYSDILMMLAEVNYYLGDESQAFSYLNQIRSRVGLPSAESVFPDFPSALISERRAEFALDGTNFIDLIRLANLKTHAPIISDITEYMNDGFQFGKHEYLPIPLVEIDYMNGNLRQNQGW